MRLSAIIFLALLITSINIKSLAQRERLSERDSLRVEQYWDTANSVSLYSLKRQAYLDSALALMPYNAFFWQQKAMPLFKQMKYEAGAPYLDSAVKYDKRKYIDYRAFMKCIFQKSYYDAITDFREAKRLNGNVGVMDHPYDFYIGLSYLQLNKLDSAEYYIQKCIAGQMQTNGEYWVHLLHWFYIGIIHYEKGLYQQAIADFDRSLKQYKNFSDAQYYKAVCLARMDKYKEALPVIQEAERNFKEGNSFTEDNAFYELYPYQVRKDKFIGAVRWIKEKSE